MPRRLRRIAVLTSGGDSPGMNAAIMGVVETAILHDIDVLGIRRGYEGLLDEDLVPLSLDKVKGIALKGGTILGTSRSQRFMKIEWRRYAVDIISRNDIDALVIIGGDGSLHGAWDLTKLGVTTIGLPGTIDNDLAGTDFTIGFDTAVHVAREAIAKIADIARTEDTAYVIEVMGRHSGFIALFAGLTSGADFIVFPEKPITPEYIAECLNQRKRGKAGSKHSVIVLAEGVMHAHEFAEKLKQLLDNREFRINISVLGYIQRGGKPTAFDAFVGTFLGHHAVKMLLKGKHGGMVGIRGLNAIFTPYSDLFAQKSIPPQSLVELADLKNQCSCGKS